jgi:hypothetical protein
VAHDSGSRLLALLALRLKGFAEPGAVGDVVGLDADTAATELKELEASGLAAYRAGTSLTGYALTGEGRAEGASLLSAELDAAGARDVVDGAYRRFLELNSTMLALCTDWQVKPGEQLNDHTDDDYDQEVIGRLVELDDQLRPVLASLRGVLRRYEPYGPRFRAALERVLGGDIDYFTKPLVPSYHTVWFELHEDLLATLGIDRANEGSS